MFSVLFRFCNELESLTKPKLVLAYLILTFMSAAGYADDIEIYDPAAIAEAAAGGLDGDPNILFILDNSGSMAVNYIEIDLGLTDLPITVQTGCRAGGEFRVRTDREDRTKRRLFRCLTRLETMKQALLAAIEGDSNDPVDTDISDVNIGLMRFNVNFNCCDGGTIIDAVAPIDALTSDTTDLLTRTNREDFIEKLQGIVREGATPLSEAMYEAYRYFDGASPFTSEVLADRVGQRAGQDVIDPAAVVDGVIDGEASAETFQSPRTQNQCQGNYVVMLSDGVPVLDTNLNSRFRDIPNLGSCSGNCLDDLAQVLKDNLGVNTFTVGFTRNVAILRSAAFRGSPNENPVLGDGYFLADDLDSLEEVFSNILSEIATIENDSFAAPAVSVSAFSRLQTREDLYYSLFSPEVHPRWQGNLKKYKIGADNVTILDQNGNGAVDSSSGSFLDTAQSYWSAETDGSDVSSGGLAGELVVVRNLFASLESDSTTVTSFGTSNIASALTEFATAMTSLDTTGALLGVLDGLMGTLESLSSLISSGTTADGTVAANAENILRWSLAEDVDQELGGTATDSNHFIGETLHSSPLVISYGVDESEPRDIVFIATNQGLLHAVTGQGADESDGVAGQVGGSERWAYLPDPDLLENFGAYYNRELDGSIDHVYGLDGAISALVQRNDSTDEIDRANLFLTQRRGGNKIFAVDVTRAYETTSPIAKLWTVEAGDTGLERLAQTWSKPVVTRFPVCGSSGCETRDALVIGGGYDESYDDETRSIASLSDDATGQNTLGNALYILDAATGEVLWSASNSRTNVRPASTGDLVVAEMDHSIPSSPRCWTLIGIVVS